MPEAWVNPMDKESMLKILKSENFSDRIISAFHDVRREDFVPDDMKKYAYANDALPIGHQQTISQPSTIAFMLSLLELKDQQKILEVGSGSGYVQALLAKISRNSEIYGIERIRELAERSKASLKNFSNVQIINADGSKGLKEKAPFDRILVSAECSELPEALIGQLKQGGILVIPIDNSIIKLRKNKKLEIEEHPGFVFVPLVKD